MSMIDQLYSMPRWYVDPEPRLALAIRANDERQWGFTAADFPSVPEDSDRLWLLVINLPDKGGKKGLERTVNELWDVIEPPSGYTKYRDPNFSADPDHLRLAPRYEYRPGIYWAEFDADAYQRLPPKAALKQSQFDHVRLGGTEVLMAVWQFPDWPLSWFNNGKPAPNLSGLRFRWRENAAWSGTPYLNRRDGIRQLGLFVHWAVNVSPDWASPVVGGY